MALNTDVGSTLGYNAILHEIEKRNIIIYPFNVKHLASSSYDVTLGEFYFEEQEPNSLSSTKGTQVFNPYSEKDVHKVWGPLHEAKTHAELIQEGKLTEQLVNIPLTAKIILIGPGKTILAHTREFIGGRKNVTTMMKARSSMGRSFIEVCKCAGWGDVGFYNKYTMEVTNNSNYYSVPLVVGDRVAQIVFFRVEGYGKEESADSSTKYTSKTHGGKYQAGDVLPDHFSEYDKQIVQQLESMWTPSQMLPRLYTEKRS